MAKEYGFQYELVQYRWPRWLHQQTEKQRIIWGYKILFLDVLFPLAVDKIIFVDADQVIRVLLFSVVLKLCLRFSLSIGTRFMLLMLLLFIIIFAAMLHGHVA